MEIRPIKAEDDRLAISHIYEVSWKFAYKGIIPQEYLDSIPKGRWCANLDKKELSSLVLIENNKYIGTLSYCQSRWENSKECGEIVALYLLPEYVGNGY